MSLRIQELAVPKGIICPLCEICGQKATTKCETCKFTHYCSDYHKTLDFKAFHTTVCHTIAYIRKEHSLPFTEEDRKHLDDIMLSKNLEVQLMADITARKWLLHENAEYAYAPAMITLNIAKELEGAESIAAIKPTCLVSEVLLNMGNLEAAKEFAILGSWISQKYDIIPSLTFVHLKRLTGLVCLKSQNWESARESFAECIYAISSEYGLKSIRMANGYGLLGLSLIHFDNLKGAMASFHKMTDMWLNFLLNQYERNSLKEATEADIFASETLRDIEFQYLESKIILRWVYEEIWKLDMNAMTDLISFKILCVQTLSQMRDGFPEEAVVFRQEAIATATRTKQDTVVPKNRMKTLMEVLGDDFILRWERKHNRPRTVATKYLEMIKAINV